MVPNKTPFRQDFSYLFWGRVAEDAPGNTELTAGTAATAALGLTYTPCGGGRVDWEVRR